MRERWLCVRFFLQALMYCNTQNIRFLANPSGEYQMRELTHVDDHVYVESTKQWKLFHSSVILTGGEVRVVEAPGRKR